LSDAAAGLFRLLGLHPGPELGAAAAASLAALPVATVRPLLAELAGAHLIAEAAPGRYTAHDLLRAYAREEADLVEYASDRASASRRLLAHYIHSADHADRRLDPHRPEPPELTGVPEGVTLDRPADRAGALRWFDLERSALLSAVHREADFDDQVWDLAWAVQPYLAHRGHWHEEIEMLTVALDAARRLGDPVKQAFAHCHLGCTAVWFADYADAEEKLGIAADLYRKADDRIGEAFVHYYFSWMLETRERNSEALEHAERALEMFTAAGHEVGQARCLNAVGWFRALAGDHDAAIEHCRRALGLQLGLGDKLRAGQTWHSLGYSYEQLGDHREAIECHRAAVELFRESGYLFSEAYALRSLGDAHAGAGDAGAARAAWQDSFDIFDQLGHPDSAKVRAKLAELPASSESERAPNA
jgi:tetratricopeptide (TPR) repeat protein